MNPLSWKALSVYWSAPEVAVNLIVFLNLLGALLLGMLVGYERAYHGRAAGMRTYGLVCMASAALTVIVGYPQYWYGAHGTYGPADPTRVIQGIVTGIGFLGAGVIMKDGFSISGLTTSASIWSASAIGVLVGVGFYAAAILLAILSAASMIWVSRIEARLPSRPAVAITLKFHPDFVPREEVLRKAARDRGYDIPESSLAISYENGRPEWRFTAVALGRSAGTSLSDLAHELSIFEGVEAYSLAPSRN